MRVWFDISNSCLVLYTIKVDNHNYKIINHILICKYFSYVHRYIFVCAVFNISSEHH